MGESTRIQTTQQEINEMNENQTEVTTEQSGEAPQSVDLSIKPKEAMPEEQPILGKFKTQEDLIAAYQELEKKMSQPATEEKPVEAPATTPNEEFSLEKFNNEYFTTGELSPESYMELGKQGYSKEVVDTYIQGQKIIQERAMNEMFEIAGGQESYTEAVTWASENWTEAQINTYNTALTQGKEMASMAIRDLMSQATAGQSSKPSLLNTNPAGSLAGGRYESSEEWIRDLKNPLYKSDPAFRAKVDAKLENSPGI